MTFETIKLETGQPLAIITLNRPDRLNSVNAIMRKELMDAVDAIGCDSTTRALLITGAGKAFCAGQDLNERRRSPEARPPDLSRSLMDGYNPLVSRIKSLKIPVICAVNGVAAGAGANLAFACDIVIAKSSARFIQSFANIGLIPDCGGTWSLARKIGQARAIAWAMTGEAISAPKAETWGLVWHCYNDDEFARESLGFAHLLAQKPTRALAAIKHAVESAYQNTFIEQLELEAELQKSCGLSDDYKEGVQAFFEKRQPAFTGN
ncbi:enoyl-CoA hydratase-related protein [Marinobacter sp.]|uniref:enoyl-CoA hydratase-related protein n=1 Tax=Marinobacter sp. TaxID=50741 RepID=UPI0034A0D32C